MMCMPGQILKLAYGAMVYSKGELVKENLTTDSNGAVILKTCILARRHRQRKTGSDRFL